MKVSVLIPVYNKAPFLRECLDSVYAQTHADLEVVAVDDHSTDDSLALLRAETDPRLRIIELPANRGPAGAANAGLDACTGAYIVRLDADDLMVPTRVEQQVAYMEAHPEVGASGGWLKLFGARDRVWKFPLDDAACKAQLLFGVPVSQGASILRRAVLEAHGLRYDPAWPRVGEDWLFWTRLARVSAFGNLDAPMTLYRRGEQNISHGRDKRADHERLVRAVFGWFNVPHTEADVRLHLMTMRLFDDALSAADVRALHEWLKRLRAWNGRERVFPVEAFEARVRQAWDGLFHALADRDGGAAWTHLRLGGTWSVGRLWYLMRKAMRR
ncbi:MAG: glycosyltransferase family 2 protein [Flavobacteriales bacterium]|nr:glycosyltransferase family 2 protein [Flavobacteriales bacterium]